MLVKDLNCDLLVVVVVNRHAVITGVNEYRKFSIYAVWFEHDGFVSDGNELLH